MPSAGAASTAGRFREGPGGEEIRVPGFQLSGWGDFRLRASGSHGPVSAFGPGVSRALSSGLMHGKVLLVQTESVDEGKFEYFSGSK